MIFFPLILMFHDLSVTQQFAITNRINQTFVKLQRLLEERRQFLVSQVHQSIHAQDNNQTLWQQLSSLSTNLSQLKSDVQRFLESCKVKLTASEFLSQYSTISNQVKQQKKSTKSLLEQENKRKSVAENSKSQGGMFDEVLHFVLICSL